VVAPATEGALVGLGFGMNAEAIGGERIAVEDESCDLRLGVVLKMKAFAGGFVGSLSGKRDLAVLAVYIPPFAKCAKDGAPGLSVERGQDVVG
jgi:hypothetical protein